MQNEAGVSLVSTASRGAGTAWGSYFQAFLPEQTYLESQINLCLRPKGSRVGLWCVPSARSVARRSRSAGLESAGWPAATSPEQEFSWATAVGTEGWDGVRAKEAPRGQPSGRPGTPPALTPSSVARPRSARPRRQACAAAPALPPLKEEKPGDNRLSGAGREAGKHRVERPRRETVRRLPGRAGLLGVVLLAVLLAAGRGLP